MNQGFLTAREAAMVLTHRLGWALPPSILALLLALSGLPAPVAAQPLRIAVPVSQTGAGDFYGRPVLDGARLAAEEANAEAGARPVELVPHDDGSTEAGAVEVARRIAASDALVVVGPALTTAAIAAGPIYAEANLAAIAPTAHGDAVTDAETTFRPVFSTGDMGRSLVVYAARALRLRRAVVIYRDNGFGRPIAEGARAAAAMAGITIDLIPFTDAAGRADAARRVTLAAENAAVILGMLNEDAVPLLVALRRQGITAPVLGPSALAGESFAALFETLPEERAARGYFTNGLFTASPIMLDSANARTLAFAERFRRRFGQEPSWSAVQGYDATNLAIQAARAAAGNAAEGDLRARRLAVQVFLGSLDSPASAVPALTGPLWFTPERGRRLPIRVGRFQGGIFESAPLQVVPVENPEQGDITDGTVFQTGAGRHARLQQVVYTGVFVNEIARLDVAQSTFTADFYLWLRFPVAAGPGAADPAEIEFPDLVRGSFDPARLAGEGRLGDGTAWRLWRLRGDFKNDFDLRRYPFDHQRLVIETYNARAASDRIIYVRDRRTIGTGTGAPTDAAANPPLPGPAVPNAALRFGGMVAPAGFRNLTQWEPQRVEQRRAVLVTESALGDLRLVGLERQRELSGFHVEVELRRRTVATLAKTLLPLAIMTLIMLAALWFPHGLVKEKVTVAITGALSGAVLLASVNAQLGAVGYTITVEYAFYVFFALCLLSIVAVLAAERQRASGRVEAAARTEMATRVMFLTMVAATVGGAGLAAALW